MISHMEPPSARDEWAPLLDQLNQKRAVATAMGGEERLTKHRSTGSLDARQRLDRLFDPGTFVELGALVGNLAEDGAPYAPADALVGGIGAIGGRPAVAAAEDFTVLGGSIGTGASDKRYRLVQLAAQERVPLVFLLEGAGHRVVNAPAGRRPNDLQALADLSGYVPMVCVVLGASAGHGALTAPLSDFVVMTPSASLFTAGPPLVKAALGEDVTKEVLGGPGVHVEQSGVVHNLATNDMAAIDLAKRYLSYFPVNAWTAPPRQETGDVGRRDLDEILDVIPPNPRHPYKMRTVLEMLVDRGSLLEVQPAYGSAVVTALAYIGGQSIAIVANDPSVLAGTIDADGADKATHFLGVVGAFHLPTILLADNPGVMSGTAAERSGALRHVARMFVAQHRLTAPKFHVTLRKAFGFGSTIMAMNPFDGQTLTLAFPAVTLGASPAASVAESSKLDDESRERVIAQQAEGAFRAANTMSYDDVIDPRQLRNALLDGLALSKERLLGPFVPASNIGVLP
jgi:acetyl-CoA carboxylase carboxyltransferase component